MRFLISIFVILAVLVPSSYGETYRWVDEKGTVHFTDDLSSIPEKYRPHAETRKPPKETSTPQPQERSKPSSPEQVSEAEGITVELIRRGEVSLAEVILNERIRQHFIVDTGASFTVISREAAKELGITIDENTPFIPIATASSVILNPLATLRSIRVGEAEVEDVDVLIHNLPSNSAGLLGNSFLSRFKVVLDPINGKMVLYSMQGTPSPDRPGGYSRDYWEGRFHFYYQVLDRLKEVKVKYEKQGARTELNRVNNAIRYFENQLSELERKASFAGVPRNWRQ